MEKVMKIGGVSVVDLANKLKTPLMIYDEDKIVAKMQGFKTNFVSEDFKTDVLYASKAFACKAIYELAKANDMSIDVVSGGELYTAKQADFPMHKVYFHGNNKTRAELEMAFDYQVGCIVADNAMECAALVDIANEKQQDMHILLRVNPGVDAHTHEYIVTAHLDSKFGTSITLKDEIAQMIKTLNESKYLHFEGFHAHIGSQIFDKQAFKAEIEKMMEFIKDMQAYDVEATTLNLGGGFAAYYTQEDQPIPLKEVCSFIIESAKEAKAKYGVKVDTLLIEPGRSIVAEAGSTLYTIGYQKQTANKHYVFIDGGMGDNIRPALYQAKYACDVVNKMDEEKTQVVTIAGKCCESGDILIKDACLPQTTSGDLLMVYTTGAYGYSMASNYNRIARPAVVFVKDGTTRLVIKRESYEDLLSLECNEVIE